MLSGNDTASYTVKRKLFCSSGSSDNCITSESDNKMSKSTVSDDTSTVLSRPGASRRPSRPTPNKSQANMVVMKNSLSSVSEYSPGPFRNLQTRYDDDLDTHNLSWLLHFNVQSLVNPGSKIHYSHQPDIDESTYVQNTAEMRSSPTTPSVPPVSHGSTYQSKRKMSKFYNGMPGQSEQISKRISYGLRPPSTFSLMIEKALTVHGEMTVSEIYKFIIKHYPSYKDHDQRWKNSVRQNLSVNRLFQKGGKSAYGPGRLWSLSPFYYLSKTPNACSPPKPREQGNQYEPKVDHVVLPQEVEAATAIKEEENNQSSRLLDDEDLSNTILGGVEDDDFVQMATKLFNSVKNEVHEQNDEVPYMKDEALQLGGDQGAYENSSAFFPTSSQELGWLYDPEYLQGATAVSNDGTPFMITSLDPETQGITIKETIVPDLY